MRSFLLAILLFVLWSFSPNAMAGLIVDTGEGSGILRTLSNQTNTTRAQWLAAEFSLDRDYYITGVWGFLRNEGNTGQNFSITIYGDGGNTPDSGNILYSNGTTISGAENSNNWEGYNITWGNGLELTAGSYWVSFEVRPNNYLNPYSGAMPIGAPNRVANEAFAQGPWYPASLGLGVRIEGTPVPEPASLFLLGTGFVGILTLRSRKR